MPTMLCNRKRSLTIAAVLCMVPVAASAALQTSGTPEVSFTALGPAGLHIVGVTHDLSVLDDNTTVTVKVPLDHLKTGIGLRDEHMKDHLDVKHFQYAVLSTLKAGLQMPSKGSVKGNGHGKLTLHGKTRDTSFAYAASRVASGIHVESTMRVNMNDFGISVPSYLGVTVRPDVDIAVQFDVADR